MSYKFDFHCHSSFSDGSLEPEKLIDYALTREIDYLALTDHDSISGLAIAENYIVENGLPIKLVNGVELSAMTEYGEVHVVGLDIDVTNQKLTGELEKQQNKRQDRARLICEKMTKLGIEDLFPRVESIAKQVITRPHIAKALVEAGHAKDIQQAFKKYLGKNGKIKVAKDWMSLEKAIALIHLAGGKAVLAHPTRYPLSNRKLGFLIENFTELSGDAMEMAYPSLNADKSAWLKIHREKNELLASSGSDFHYPDLKWTDLGRFPRLDETIPHIRNKII